MSDFSLGGFLSDLLGPAAGLYLTNEEIRQLEQAGTSAFEGYGDLAETISSSSQFKPYTVTSDLASFTVGPQGGLNLQLSDEQRKAQQARLQQAESLLSMANQDPQQLTNQYFESIRAAQRPEEERMRRGLEQSLFSTGRGGISTAEYGGTREEFMMDKAQQEALLGAAATARQTALNEQAQAREQAGYLTDLAYAPQRQALELFGASTVPTQLAQRGQLAGMELFGDLSGRGLEARLGAEEEAARLRLERMRSFLPLITGTQGASGDPTGGLFQEGGLFGSGGFFDNLLGGILNRDDNDYYYGEYEDAFEEGEDPFDVQ